MASRLGQHEQYISYFHTIYAFPVFGRKKSWKRSKFSIKMVTVSSLPPSFATSWPTSARSLRTRKWTRWSVRRISTGMARSTTRSSWRWWCPSKTLIWYAVIAWSGRVNTAGIGKVRREEAFFRATWNNSDEQQTCVLNLVAILCRKKQQRIVRNS